MKAAIVLSLACWLTEYNPATGVPYASESEWEQEVYAWTEKEVPVNPLRLKTAHQVYLAEKNKAAGMANDKIAHCYMGCKIGERTDLTTVQFTGWYKEYQDLTDCSLTSHFEVKDFEATVYGGHLSLQAAPCEQTCTQVFGN